MAGITVGYKMCCNTTRVDPSEVAISYGVVEDIRKEFTYPGASMSIRPSPVTAIRRDKWICLSGIALICQSARKMAGLGDNISGAGFVHHHMKR